LVVSGPLPTGHVSDVTQHMRIGHFFARNALQWGRTLRSKLPLIIIVAPWKLYSE